MKTAISIPDPVFKLAERTAKRLKVSRSELFTRAMREYLGRERDARVTASYDEAFVDESPDDISAFRREAGARILRAQGWNDE